MCHGHIVRHSDPGTANVTSSCYNCVGARLDTIKFSLLRRGLKTTMKMKYSWRKNKESCYIYRTCTALQQRRFDCWYGAWYVGQTERVLTPCRGSAGHPWSSESCPWPHSPGNCWVLEDRKSRTMSYRKWLTLCSRWVCVRVCACVKKQAPCLCGQEVLGHTRFWFDKDPKLSSFSLSVARSARKL